MSKGHDESCGMTDQEGESELPNEQRSSAANLKISFGVGNFADLPLDGLSDDSEKRMSSPDRSATTSPASQESSPTDEVFEYHQLEPIFEIDESSNESDPVFKSADSILLKGEGSLVQVSNSKEASSSEHEQPESRSHYQASREN
ncbi:hypothetical protein M231_03977 [Tremella mesenterica]|uniref:Uncharacterized protein n=1 Tax=Tremella mesenterica TaxID=5217 RepID=A0A4Q1BLX0_TREME|nr:uncharacterized protein TREMEDRAFT_64782 [Tremella mesenterica DSM 1558]EIW66927.1 hypothetical protein TREMEDRAFT_64782 [Tremella mesenterica DSM 1558]RXK38801.1 hypothetical protein M231_03977 [Tremella mesenterica]